MLPSVCVGAFSVASAAPGLHGAAHNHPAWAEQLKGQTIIEDAQEGHVERTAMMERQHQRIMEKINEQLVHDAEGAAHRRPVQQRQYVAPVWRREPGFVVDVEQRR